MAIRFAEVQTISREFANHLFSYPQGPIAWRVNIEMNFGRQMNARLFGWPAADTLDERCHVHFIAVRITPSGIVSEFC